MKELSLQERLKLQKEALKHRVKIKKSKEEEMNESCPNNSESSNNNTTARKLAFT